MGLTIFLCLTIPYYLQGKRDRDSVCNDDAHLIEEKDTLHWGNYYSSRLSDEPKKSCLCTTRDSQDTCAIKLLQNKLVLHELITP